MATWIIAGVLLLIAFALPAYAFATRDRRSQFEREVQELRIAMRHLSETVGREVEPIFKRMAEDLSRLMERRR